MASQSGSQEIETEHLLMGLLRADKMLAKRFLGSPWAGETVWKKIDASKPKRERAAGSKEIPLSSESKRVLLYALEEADLSSNRRICTAHLLLGLLREGKSLAAKILSELNVELAETRNELSRTPHDDSQIEEFVRERGALPEDVVELQSRIKSIRAHVEDAISRRDFQKARACSDEEGVEREKLLRLYDQYGLLDWIFD